MTQKRPLPESVAPKEFAEALGCPMATLRYRIKAGIVPSPVRYGRMLRWPRDVVEAYLATGIVTAKAVL